MRGASLVLLFLLLCTTCCFGLNERDEQIIETIEEVGVALIRSDDIKASEFNAVGTRVEELLQTDLAPFIVTGFDSIFGENFLTAHSVINVACSTVDVRSLWENLKLLIFGDSPSNDERREDLHIIGARKELQ